MTSDAIARLRRHRKTGVDILIEFIKATPETAAGIVKCAQAWASDLIPKVPDIDLCIHKMEARRFVRCVTSVAVEYN